MDENMAMSFLYYFLVNYLLWMCTPLKTSTKVSITIEIQGRQKLKIHPDLKALNFGFFYSLLTYDLYIA